MSAKQKLRSAERGDHEKPLTSNICGFPLPSLLHHPSFRISLAISLSPCPARSNLTGEWFTEEGEFVEKIFEERLVVGLEKVFGQ